jgi:hypothetical protein
VGGPVKKKPKAQRTKRPDIGRRVFDAWLARVTTN